MNGDVVSRRQFLESKVATGKAIMAITQSMLENWFTYHSPTADDQVGYVAIRVAAKALAETIVKYSPTSADQSAAIRLLREAVMTANASIACKGQ